MANGRSVWVLACAVAMLAIAAGCSREVVCTAPAGAVPAFEARLEELRDELRIVGMSGAIAKDGEVVWARGFGWADRERRVAATRDSVYHLASLTKPYAATVLLQLVDEGRLDLNRAASEFGVDVENAEGVKVWHLLSHSVSAPPGTRYRYDGGAFGELEKVIQSVTGRTFASELNDRITRPLELRHTAPNPLDEPDFVAVSPEVRRTVERDMVKGYAPAYGRGVWPSGLFGPIRPMDDPTAFHTSAGLVASAPDVARFSMALDEGRLLSEAARARAMTPVTTPSGETLPYGLGWFVQEYCGTTLVWHYGQWFNSSSLIVKVPSRRLTFVLLANSDALSRRRRLGDHGDLLRSPAARLFLENFVAGRSGA